MVLYLNPASASFFALVLVDVGNVDKSYIDDSGNRNVHKFILFCY